MPVVPLVGLARSSCYYVPRMPARDARFREEIRVVIAEHPAYGHRRIALHLHVNKKRVLRVMRKFGLTPQIMRKHPKNGRRKPHSGIPNLLASVVPDAPNVVWVGDFTYLWYRGRYLYLATVLDACTREVIGWQIGIHHTADLVRAVLEEAWRKREYVPVLFHSDQGSEYASHACYTWLGEHGVAPSHSPKGKPWVNGRQESFFSSFKLEFGKTMRYLTIEALIEAIGRYIHYYNTKRIHSALKMPPRTYALRSVKTPDWGVDLQPQGV